MLLSGDPAAASELCKEALRLDPDLGEGKACFKVAKKAQRLKADALRKFNARDFEGAAQAWSELLEVVEPPPKAPLYAAALAGRATAQLRLKRFDECLKDCAKALYAAEDCKEAWLAKASALHALGRHEEALADLTALMQGWGSGDTMLRHAHEKADFEVRKAKRPDFYKALGAPHKACEAEIKTQYRQRALEYHPDKWMDRSAEEREAAEAHFKTLGTYLEILTDPFKRQLYDEGYDQEAIEQRVAAAQRAAHENPNRHHRH
jgi:DnaJ family protein C protein 7